MKLPSGWVFRLKPNRKGTAVTVYEDELILCKDCRWYTINELKKDGTDDRRYKPSYCLRHGMHMDEDWFCADGERGEEDEID